jgi:hypothetical protein
MNAYLIDPRTQRIEIVDLGLDDDEMRERMRRMIGAEWLDYQTISTRRDSLWVEEMPIRRGVPVWAFKLPLRHEPYGGRAIVIGADEIGASCAPAIPLDVLRRDIDWLGLIVPEVTWVTEPDGARAVITYRRASR